LETAGVLDNTLLIFTSDNGGDFCPEEQEARALGFKNNGDIRGDKHLIYQGGFKVPFIVRWPGHVGEGTESDRMINVVDIYSTVQEVVSGKVLDPKTAAPDSFSFYSELVKKTAKKDTRETMVQNDVKGVKAIRMGDWKYIENKALRPEDKVRQEQNPKLTKPELYNLKKDPAEAENVIDQFPEVAEKMQKELDRIQDKGSERLAVKYK
jgi:arylsulfatase A-like enzyme